MRQEFVTTASGRLLLTFNESNSKKAVLLVSPFGDEMNKSRPTFNELASKSDLAVVLPDLFGTGDSAGEFIDADIDSWQRNLSDVCDLLERRDIVVVAVVGLRFGCLLAARWMVENPEKAARLVLCQPVLRGSVISRQMLRLTIASRTLKGTKVSMNELLAQIEAGEPVNCGGYPLSAKMLDGLNRMELMEDLQLLRGVGISVFEVVSSGTAEHSSVGKKLLGGLPETRIGSSGVVSGDPFWTSTEVVRNVGFAEMVAQCLKD